MKPFNRERALAGDPVCTRDGLEVEIGGRKEGANDWTLVGWIHYQRGWFAHAWQDNGRRYGTVEDDSDLFMATNRHTVWCRAWKFVGGNDINIATFSNKDDLLLYSATTPSSVWLDPEPWPHEVEE